MISMRKTKGLHGFGYPLPFEGQKNWSSKRQGVCLNFAVSIDLKRPRKLHLFSELVWSIHPGLSSHIDSKDNRIGPSRRIPSM
jgi:hypothetical protein